MFKEIFTSKKFKNFSYLSIAQAFNYLFPLILFPYLIRVIGIDKFGLIMYTLAIIQFFQITIEYGFTLVAAKEIAQNKINNLKLSIITNTTIASKLFIFLIIVTLFFIFYFIFSKYINYIELYLFSIGILLADVFFVKWFFQGMEEMHYIPIFQFISKFIYIILVLIFVNAEEDFIYVLLFQGVGQITIAFLSCLLISKKYNIKYIEPKLIDIKHYIIQGWPLFISDFFVKLYTSTNVIILGYISGDYAVGIYSIAEKVIFALNSLISISYNQVIYPSLSSLSYNIDLLKIKIKKYAYLLLTINIFMAINIFIFSEYIINLLVGHQEKTSIIILQILSLSIIIFPFGSFFTQILVILKKNKYVMKVSFYTLISNYILIIPLILIFDVYGLAITIVLVRLIHLSIHLIYQRITFKNLKLNIIDKK